MTRQIYMTSQLQTPSPPPPPPVGVNMAWAAQAGQPLLGTGGQCPPWGGQQSCLRERASQG